MTTETAPPLAAPAIQKTTSSQAMAAAKTPAIATPVAGLSLGAARGLTTCGPQARREASLRR
ncbi:hypothetical protein [Niveispirillum irakense]|uniref:hypothetical protein n=1 Tax=Niveispirillum irakense TaxID=34011 RepID=UPI0012B63D61|nr:hypothetical protein [Niveispirillum irakense]